MIASTAPFVSLLLRSFLIIVSAAAIALAIHPITTPAADASLFAADQALIDLDAITQAPRPMGSDAIAATRAYLIAQIEALGAQSELQTIEHVQETPSRNLVAFSVANNVVARLPGSDSSGAILIGAHYDSAPTAPGASDCGGCVVVALETLRQLAAAPPLKNDVIFAWVDGEEVMRSSQAFVDNHPWASAIRAAINMEAMGTGGASVLYVHGDHSGWLVREALATLPQPRAYAFVNALVWATGTGGSDLDQYLQRAEIGVGFAYFGRTAFYHTPYDDVDHTDPLSLAQQGANVLALVNRLGNADLSAVPVEDSPIYFNLIGDWVMQYPAALTLPLAVLAVALVIGVIVWRRVSVGGVLVSVILLSAALVIAGVVAVALWQTLRLLDPRLHVFLLSISYDTPAFTAAFAALTVAFVSGGAAIFARRLKPETLWVGGAALLALFGLLTALALPGMSYIFTLPALATLLLLAWLLGGERGESARGVALTLIGAFALLIGVPLAYFLGAVYAGRAEILSELPMIPLLGVIGTMPLALALLPQLAFLGGRRRGTVPLISAAICGLLIVGIQITASFTPERPKPNMIVYEYDADTGVAQWMTVADTYNGRTGASLIDPWTAQFFPDGYEESRAAWWGFDAWGAPMFAYRAPAPITTIAAPELTVLSDTRANDQRELRLQLTSPARANTLEIGVTSASAITAAAVNGLAISAETFAAPEGGQLTVLVYVIPEAGVTLDLTLAGHAPVTLAVTEVSYRLPDFPIAPRPAWMMAAPTFRTDSTVTRRRFTVAGAT